MSGDGSNPLVGPNQLIRSIDEFSSTVASYLLPVLRFVGHKDVLFDGLVRQFAGLVHEKRFSGDPAHLIIFDHIPHELLSTTGFLNANTAYVFCLEEGERFSDEELNLLSKRVAVTLFNPELDELIWHVKALLVLQDVSFSNEHSAFATLLSIDPDYRRAICSVIASVFDGRSCLVSVSSEPVRETLIDFLFGSLPKNVSPLRIKGSTVAIDALPTDRLSLVDDASLSLSDLKAFFNATEAQASQPQLMAITVGHSVSSISDTLDALCIDLPDLQHRLLDTHLLSYWCSTFKSHTDRQVKYYADSVIKKMLKKSGFSANEFADLLLDEKCTEKTTIDILTQLVDTYDRLSIDDIMSEAERHVMIKLRMQCEIVEAASNAAGIPKVTFNKRMRRLEDRTSLLGLLSNTKQ